MRVSKKKNETPEQTFLRLAVNRTNDAAAAIGHLASLQVSKAQAKSVREALIAALKATEARLDTPEETDEERTARKIEQRISQASQMLRVVGNLGQREEMTADAKKKILSHLRDTIEATHKRLTTTATEEAGFKL